jgi:hypothetical protein
MIRHENVGVNLPAGLGANLDERLDEAQAIRFVQEDWLAPVTAIHDVVDRTGILDSHLSGHDPKVACAALLINIKNRPIYHPIYHLRPL